MCIRDSHTLTTIPRRTTARCLLRASGLLLRSSGILSPPCDDIGRWFCSLFPRGFSLFWCPPG
eukprot:3663279-Alexandrium_andersonii.AAC.1